MSCWCWCWCCSCSPALPQGATLLQASMLLPHVLRRQSLAAACSLRSSAASWQPCQAAAQEQPPPPSLPSPKQYIALHYVTRLKRPWSQQGSCLLALCSLLQLVVNRAKRTVPYPLLGENTLVLSDVLCLSPNKAGQLCLTCRCASTPLQSLRPHALMHMHHMISMVAPKTRCESCPVLHLHYPLLRNALSSAVPTAS